MYKLTKSNGTVIKDEYPNWVKKEVKYNTFICCTEEDAECVLIQEGEGESSTSNYYNVNTARYPEYDTVIVTRL